MESLSLNLDAPRPETPPPQPLAPIPKKPGVAFFLSLLFPGFGHLYCDAFKRAFWTMGLSAACFAGAVLLIGSAESAGLGGMVWAMCFRGLLGLYVYGFLDAYFTAREMSEGRHALMEYNPRVAGALNLLTRGFGYWYLDERKWGLGVFFLSGAIQRAVTITGNEAATTAAGFISEIFFAAIAVHGFQWARRKNLKTLPPPESPALAPPQPAGGLRAGVPVAFACFIAFCYYGLITLGLFADQIAEQFPDESAISDTLDHSQASTAAMDGGLIYKNAKYGIEIFIPSNWKFDSPGFFELASASQGDCTVSLNLESGHTGSNVEIVNTIASGFAEDNPSYRLIERNATTLAGGTAHEFVFTRDMDAAGPVQQHYVVARRGAATFMLISTAPAGLVEACGPDFKAIRDRVVIPRDSL